MIKINYQSECSLLINSFQILLFFNITYGSLIFLISLMGILQTGI